MGEASNEYNFVIRKPERNRFLWECFTCCARIILKCILMTRDFRLPAAKQMRTELFWVLTDVSGQPTVPILTTEGGTDRLSRNVGKKLPPLAA